MRVLEILLLACLAQHTEQKADHPRFPYSLSPDLDFSVSCLVSISGGKDSSMASVTSGPDFRFIPMCVSSGLSLEIGDYTIFLVADCNIVPRPHLGDSPVPD